MNNKILRSCLTLLGVLVGLNQPVAFAIQDSTSDRTGIALPAMLLKLVQTYRISIVAEISEPVCRHIVVPSPEDRSFDSTLQSITSQCLGYVWKMDHGVVLFGQNELLAAPGNPMNIQLKSYSLPSDLNFFKLTFPAKVISHGGGGGGAAVEGFGLPRDLSPQLQPKQYSDVIARTVILDVAAQVGNLFSVLVLPSEHPLAKDLGNRAFISWEIAGGPGMSSYTSTTFVRRIP